MVVKDVGKEMSFLEHLRELRSRLLRCFIGLGIFCVLCFFWAKDLYAWLANPMVASLSEDVGSGMVFLSPVEPFFVYLKLSFLASVFILSPYLFFELWGFISPGLYASERRISLVFVFFASLVFILGGVFCFFVVMPLGLETLLRVSVGGELGLSAQITMNSYFDLVTKMMFAFGLIFEMPIFSYFFSKIGLLDWRMLSKHWRVSVVAIFVLAAILTPPDVVTQILLSIPMLFLYFVSIGVSYVVNPAGGQLEKENVG